MHILIVHAFTSTHWHMHPNKASHSVAFVKIRWTPGSAAAKLSWEDSNNCGLLYDPLETLVPCKDFMRSFCVSNMGFITELWMVAFFLRFWGTLLRLCRINSNHVMQHLYPLVFLKTECWTKSSTISALFKPSKGLALVLDRVKQGHLRLLSFFYCFSN